MLFNRRTEVLMEVKPKYERGQPVIDTFENRHGIITGKTRKIGDTVLWEVSFGNSEGRAFIDEDELTAKTEEDDLLGLFKNQLFGTILDLRILINSIRMKGELTNVYYSMHIGMAEFMPHQFKPVMKFIESTTGKLLIADEVGLGKTIESLYIWKELVARENAKRLLLLVPSSLREKWKNDMLHYFGIEADIVDAAALLGKLKEAAMYSSKKQFALIASLEGVRQKEIDDFTSSMSSAREQLAYFLEEKSAENSQKLLDLTIIDEAHYLRNSSTASFRTGERIRDVSSSLLLLSATPIQTSEDNLFNLLRLMSPEEYYDKQTFKYFIEENKKLIELANAIRSKESLYAILEKIEKAKKSYLTQNDSFFDVLEKEAAQKLHDNDWRIHTFLTITSKYFYDSLINRTRKRDVFENRIIRTPETREFAFTVQEKSIYNRVTKYLQDKVTNNFSVFTLIARQRQMTSSLPAALRQWQSRIVDEDQLSDDFGEIDEDISPFKLNMSELIGDDDIDLIEKLDSKYKIFIKIVKGILANGYKKIVVFSFYRGTIEYITKRLNEDGISAVSIMGGMGNEKNAVINQFKNELSIKVLVSSEVGSEGIDLQFASVEINYDLPWNPMRLEQRIGRIDRIGQKEKKILIYNLTCKDTIEDRVIERLYDRIEIFKYSIGDIEEILGTKIHDLAVTLMSPTLSEEEKEKQAEQTIEAITQKKQLCEKLEDKASLSVEYRDYILKNITTSNKNGRYISDEDIKQYIMDFFDSGFYKGTRIDSHESSKGLIISLSLEAKSSLSDFIKSRNSDKRTSLTTSSSGLLCVFSLEESVKVQRNIYEYVDISHPLIRWIHEEFLNGAGNQNCCSMVSIPLYEAPGFPCDYYVYFVQEWEFKGLINRKEIHVAVADENGNVLDDDCAETLFNKVLKTKHSNFELQRYVKNIESLLEAVNCCEGSCWDAFEKERAKYESENTQRYEKQKNYLIVTSERKIKKQEDTLNKLIMENKSDKIIRLNTTKLENLRIQFGIDLQKIEKKKNVSSNPANLGIGIIKVEKNGEKSLSD